MNEDVKICPNCNKGFTINDLDKSIPSHLLIRSFKSRRFCCQSCNDEFHLNKKAKEKHLRKVLEINKNHLHSCERCGFSETLDIHHIKQRKDGGNNSPDNLIILCPNCHALFHRGIINQDELIKLKKMIEVTP